MPTRPEIATYRDQLCNFWCEALGDEGDHHVLLAAFQNGIGACRQFLDSMDDFDGEFSRHLDANEDVVVAFNSATDLAIRRLNENRERIRETVIERMRPDYTVICAIRSVIVLNERFNAKGQINWTGDTDVVFNLIECNCPGQPQLQYIPVWAQAPGFQM